MSYSNRPGTSAEWVALVTDSERSTEAARIARIASAPALILPRTVRTSGAEYGWAEGL